MDVLADFLKMAGVAASVDPSPLLDEEWSHSGGKQGRSTSDAQLRMFCVAAGAYQLDHDGARESLTVGDVAFMLESCAFRLSSSAASSTLVVGSILFRAGDLALGTLNLPNVSVVRGIENPESKELVVRLASEVLLARSGSQPVTECLATCLFISSLRASHCSQANQSGGKGWLRALVDPEIGSALRLMHQAPEYRWTVAELADQLSISRSAFAERFKRITGRPPLEYLTWWRLQRAAARLRSDESVSMYELARCSGYQSEAAFSKAFRREFGVSPGSVRRQAVAQKATPSQLQLEIKKRNPFELPEQETSLNLVKSFDVIRKQFDELLSSHNLSAPEYNILRILRGNNRPMTIDEVESQLLVPIDNLGHYLEQLVSKKFVVPLKESSQWEIAKHGKAVIIKLDDPTISLHRRQFANFSAGEIAEFNRLLVKLRTPAS